jgi:hypothetical protein
VEPIVIGLTRIPPSPHRGRPPNISRASLLPVATVNLLPFSSCAGLKHHYFNGPLGSSVLEFGGQASAAVENWLIGHAGHWFIVGAMTLIVAAIVGTALRSRARDRNGDEIKLATERSSSRW